MKKIFAAIISLIVLSLVGAGLVGANVCTGTDSSNGAFQIDVNNFTPGQCTGAISFDLFANTPQTVNGRKCGPLDDLFITEYYHLPANNYSGQGLYYTWAIPLQTHGSFVAGDMYAVGSYLTSNCNTVTLAQGSISSDVFSNNMPLRITAEGDNYGNGCFTGGSVTTVCGGGDGFKHEYEITTDVYEDDPNATFSYTWGTCDISAVPEPGSLILLGTGLFGMIGFMRKKILS